VAQPFELGQFGRFVTVEEIHGITNVGVGTSVVVSGIISAISFSGDGSGLTGVANTDFIVSAASTSNITFIEESLTVGTSVTITQSGIDVSGVITATSYRGDGSQLSGISVDSSSLVDSNLATRVQATTSGATVTGILTATSFSGDGSNLTGIDATTIQTGTTKVQTQATEINNIVSGSGIGTFTSSGLNVTGVITATSFVGDGSGITNAGSSLSAASGTQRVVLTSQTTGTMTASSTDSNLTYDQSTGTLSATYLSGDGSGITNAGSSLSSSTGTERFVLTSQTTGTMTSSATNGDLYYDTTTKTVNAENFSGLSTSVAFHNTFTVLYTGSTTNYSFSGYGLDGTETDPDLYLTRGQQYRFINELGAHPLRIQSTANGSVGTQYNDGLSTNDVDNGVIEWNVMMDAPSELYYQCTSHTAMGGRIYIADPTAAAPSSTLVDSNGTVTVDATSIYNVTLKPGRSGVRILDYYQSYYGGPFYSTYVYLGGKYGSADSTVIMGAQSNAGNQSPFGSTYNTIIGSAPFRSLTSGTYNTILGGYCAPSLSSGSYNTYVGYYAAANASTGSNNVCIGRAADVSSGTASNEVTLGNSLITQLRCQVTTITALSDRRDKENIEDIPVGLSYINAMRPVKFDWKMRSGENVGKKQFGFIAQELDEVQDKFGYKEYTNLVYHSNPDKLEATPMNTYPILVKAVQELSQQNEDLLRRIEELEKRLGE
jgi:hypothetical protein